MTRLFAGVALITLVAAACASEPATTEPSTTGGPQLVVEGFAFGQVPSVAPGGSFEITNNDSGRHTFTSNDDSWESLDLPAGETVTFIAPDAIAPGEYSFFCAVHPDSMGGRLTVAG